jgi:hypothetical protein
MTSSPPVIQPISSPSSKKWIYLLAIAAPVLPFAAYAFLRLGVAWPCPFKAYTGLPCATCGGTRALAALCRLDFLGAIRFNPLVVLGVFVLITLPFVTYRPAPKVFWPIFWTAIGLNWLYLTFFLPR